MSKVSVRIDSSRPVFIEADADSFGQVFAAMSDEDQVHVFRAIVEHMKPHKIQWDYIAIALEKYENRDVRDQLSVIFPDIAAKDAEIAKLEEARAEQWRLRRDVEGSRDAAKAACDSMRIERDKLKEAMEGICHFSDALNFRNDHLSKALAQWIEAGRAALKEKADV